MTASSDLKLLFPQLAVQYHKQKNSQPWLLITGGRPPQASWLQKLQGFSCCWAADHGIDICQQTGIRPALLLGDGDSASSKAWNWAVQQGIPVKKYPAAKDLTDTQLALACMVSAGAPFLILTGTFGGRFDHAFSTIFSAANSGIPCCLIDETEALFYVTADQPITLTFQEIPKAISLLPLTASCSGVTIDRVHWPLAGATLMQKLPNAVSNELLTGQKDTSVSISSGILGVYCYWGCY